MSNPTGLAHRRFTRDEVVRMVDAGILSEDEKVELIDGELILVPPQGPPYAGLAARFLRLFSGVYGDGFSVRPSLPLDCNATNVPEPDLAVVRGAESVFLARHPRADEALIVVEIVRTSHDVDRKKTAVYARTGIPVFWFVDVSAARIELHEDPQPDGRYRLVRVLAGSDTISPPQAAVSWTVASLLT